MKESLRKDLQLILLEECYGRKEKYARALVEGKVFPRPSDREALDETNHALNRIAARCSVIQG